jgi:hypothetical protein
MLSAVNVLNEALGELFVAIQENSFRCWTRLCGLNYIIARANVPSVNVKVIWSNLRSQIVVRPVRCS